MPIFKTHLGRGHGDHLITVDKIAGANKDSHVVASINERNSAGQDFIGAARMSILAICPFEGGTIQIGIRIESTTDLNYRLRYTLL
jgi:hypothetical protein